MDKEEKLKMEISHIARHQEIDRFNYNDARIVFLGSLTAILAIITFLQNIFSIDKAVTLKLIIYNLLFLTVIGLSVYNLINLRRANKHFMIRERMIERRLLHFDIKKDDIDKEFRQTRKNMCL